MPRSEFDSLYSGKYLKAEDVSDFTARIVDVTVVAFEKGPKAVLFLEAQDQGLVLNKTNAETLKSAFGKNFKDWIGMLVTVHQERAMFNGKSVPALRVYPTRPTPSPIAPVTPSRMGPPTSSAAEPYELPPLHAYENDLERR